MGKIVRNEIEYSKSPSKAENISYGDTTVKDELDSLNSSLEYETAYFRIIKKNGIVILCSKSNHLPVQTQANAWTTQFTLNDGYKPLYTIENACILGTNANVQGVIRANTDGTVQIYAPSAQSIGFPSLTFITSD